MMQLLKNMYEQNLQAELASLKSGYDSDVAELERQNELITQEYQKAQNQAAAQNALERQRMGEVALAQGLNTGASGQFALAQNAALQGSLANLETQRASSIADNHLLAAKLLNQYTGDANKARAEINAQLSSALYDEMVRQQTLAAQQQKATRDDVLTLIAGNVMPSAEMLAEAGMSQQEALLWQALANGGTTAKPADKGTDVQPQLGDNGGYSGNMGLEDWQVREMQRFYGADIDGKWGAQSSTKAGNKNAKDAWDSYQTVVAGYQRELNDDGTFASGGDVASGSYWTGANSSQKGNVTSFDYDPDEGIIVWAGNAYSSLDQVIADINSANLSPQEKEVLRRKMELWFGAGNVSFD